MPRSVEIEDFAAKLALVRQQLDWSRARLAQRVGIDKSLAGRWTNGVSRPTAHSLGLLTSAVAQAIPGLKSDDWHLPVEQFALRVGADPVTAARAAAKGHDARMTIAGLKFPPIANWGEPYLGLWAGFYQSILNKGVPRLFALRFFIDDLGLRCEAVEGTFKGEGPVIATRSHLQCLFDVGPLYDRVGHCIFNGVHAPRAAIIDGLVCIIAGDPGGTPTASPIVVYRLDEDPLDETAAHMDALGAAIKQIHERAEAEGARSGDKMAVMRELAPPEILQAVTPVVGDERDHVLRVPTTRSLAAGTLESDTTWRPVARNLRRALGLERERPQLRLLGRPRE
jgi:transcriptional regulator with XRE-family HTH domain